MPEEFLPKPQTDLPLPEKELPEHATEPAAVKNDASSPVHQSKSKLAILAFIVLLVIFGTGAGAYVMGRNSVFKELNPSNPAIPPKDPDMYKGTPTPDPTADWETFAGENFSFKYPQDGYEAVITNEAIYSSQNNIDIKNGIRQSMKVTAPVVIEAADVNIITPSGAISSHGTNFSVWVFQNPDNLTALEWYQKYWYYPFNWGEAIESEIQKNAPVNKIFVDGKPGGYITQDSKGKVQHILVPDGNQMYLFEVLGEKSAETVGNQILSTFKFTDSSSSDGSPVTSAQEGEVCGYNQACADGLTCQASEDDPITGTCVQN